jgi:hypothetical protein
VRQFFTCLGSWGGQQWLDAWASQARLAPVFWSFCDVLDFHASAYGIVVRELATATSLLAGVVAEGNGHLEFSKFRPLYTENLTEVTAGLELLPLSAALRYKTTRCLDRLGSSTIMVSEAQILLRELNNDLLTEMAGYRFLRVPDDKRELYQQSAPLFGSAVHAQFPDAQSDIAAAGRCLAFDEWTASVFHLMRVIEKGLHYLSNDLGVNVPGGVEYSDWGPTVAAMEVKIKEMRQLPKGPQKAESLRFYSQVASSFRYFKDGWRNDTAHSRSSYDEGSALNVWQSANHFMRALADHKASTAG